MAVLGRAAAGIWAHRRASATRFLLAWILPFWLIIELLPAKASGWVVWRCMCICSPVFHWQETRHSWTERGNILILLKQYGLTGSVESLETPVVMCCVLLQQYFRKARILLKTVR